VNTHSELEHDLEAMVRDAGAILLRHFGKVRNIRRKENASSVVCEGDLAAEASLLKTIRARYPDDSIIAEESGSHRGSSSRHWILDPLDGTSNFVAGLPWFGVQVGLLEDGQAKAAAMYLPVENTLFISVAGQGVRRNGKPVHVTSERSLSNVLCAFGFDPVANPRQSRANINLLMRVSRSVRNTRTTNSLWDFCYALDGQFGGCINLNCRIWDIIPLVLMMPEAGGKITDIAGRPISFDLGETASERVYTVLGASKRLHARLLEALQS